MLCTRATVEARLRLPWVQEAGEARGGRGGLLLIANYLSRQLRTIIRHAVRGACAAFRDIARVRSELSLSLSPMCARMRACVRVCCARGERCPRRGGERNRCTRQRDADRRCSFSFFLASPSSFAFRSASPSLPPPFPLHSPRKACLPVSLSHPPSSFLSVSVQRSRARITGSFAARLCSGRYHGSICSRALSRTRRTLGTNLVARVAVHRECSIIARSVGTTKRGGRRMVSIIRIYIYRYCFDCLVSLKRRID